MRVLLEARPWTRHVDVRIGTEYGHKVQYASGIDERGELVWTIDDDGVEIPPLFTVSREVLEAFAVALGAFVPSADATVEALKDTRAVRDRLLTLVEELAE